MINKEIDQIIYQLKCPQSSIDVEHEYTDCNNSNCEKNDYCSCYAKLIFYKINSFNINNFILFLTLNVNNILSYCIDKIVRIVNPSIDSFYLEIVPGYYGDESFVKLKSDVFYRLGYEILKLKDLSEHELIKYILELQYKDIQDEFYFNNKMEVNIEDINIDEIRIPEPHTRKYLNLNENFDKNSKIPQCIVAKKSNKIYLVEGFYQIEQAKINKIKTISSIILT